MRQIDRLQFIVDEFANVPRQVIVPVKAKELHDINLLEKSQIDAAKENPKMAF